MARLALFDMIATQLLRYNCFWYHHGAFAFYNNKTTLETMVKRTASSIQKLKNYITQLIVDGLHKNRKLKCLYVG